jgi:hypothetical protein
VGYRAAALVGGMAAGAFVGIDLAALALLAADEDTGWIALGLFVAGMVMLFGAYRIFRYAEQYEYHRYGKPREGGGLSPLNLPGSLAEVREVVKTLEKMQ